MADEPTVGSQETASGLDRPEIAPGLHYQIPAWVFSNGKITVRSSVPIVIRLTKEDGVFVAEHDKLDIYAVGETPAGAVEDFSRHLLDFYVFYTTQNPTALVGNAIRLRKVFKSVFQEE